jgi:hypothetical protein
MKTIAVQLNQLARDFAGRHRQLPEEITLVKLEESKWTLKEIIGHLIDSASNNHQRITRLQLTEELHFPAYENEKWLVAEKWNRFGWQKMLNLFEHYNVFIAHLIEHANPDCLKNRWFGRDRSGERIFTLEEMMTDYLRHFKEHLEHFETRLKEIRAEKSP